MKKSLLLFSLLIVASGVFAQEKRAPFHVSFVPPLSTNGTSAWQYSNGGSFSLLVGVSGAEENFSFAGLATLTKHDMNGFNFAGLLNHAGGSGRGFQFAGLANMLKNEYKGFQFAGLLNSAGYMEGFQFSGLANIVRNDYKGFQFSGLLNSTGDTRGFQFSGLLNKARSMGGLQFAGLGNVAADLRGFQFGGLFNVARNVHGAQFAGLVNIAESSDYPIALINIIRDGEYGISFSYNDMGSAIASFRSGGRVTYGILGVGYNHEAKDKGVVTEGGFGAHINVTKWFRINNEIKGGTIGNFSKSSTFYSNYALMPAFRLHRHLEVFGGPSINYMNTDNLDNANLFPKYSIWKNHKASGLQQVYVGFQAGVQIIL